MSATDVQFEFGLYYSSFKLKQRTLMHAACGMLGPPVLFVL